jgi:hypothetical protein
MRGSRKSHVIQHPHRALRDAAIGRFSESAHGAQFLVVAIISPEYFVLRGATRHKQKSSRTRF